MKIYRDFGQIKFDKDTVITVGTFDGVHLGHQQIIKRLLAIQEEKGYRGVVITFDPHPQITLQKKDRPPISLLTNINERLEALRRFGVEHTVVATFSYEFSQTPAEEFVSEYLCGKIGLSRLLIGYDHMFGRDRGGDKQLLEKLGAELDFHVERMDALQQMDTVVSSTKIREALQSCRIEEANALLGYNYFVQGTVVPGDARGRTIGYPTANIMPPDKHKLIPGNGVYMVRSEIDGQNVFGLANVGTRPTFTEDTVPTLEVYFLDLNRDLYGKSLNIEFMRFIRPEEKFSGVEELVRHIESDVAKALVWIGEL